LDKKIDSLILMISVSGGRFPRGGRWAHWSRRLPLQFWSE